MKPVLIKAFAKSKDMVQSKNKNADLYVGKGEFRYLILYIRQYYELYVAFAIIDKDDDRNVDYEEFLKAVPMLKSWGVNMSNPEKEFKECDQDGHGQINFSEFCDWAICRQLNLEDLNDNDEDN